MRFIVTNITKDTSSRCGKLWQDRRWAVGCRNLLTQSRELFFAALFYMRKFSSIGGILNKTSAAGQQSVIWLSEDQNMELWRTELIYWRFSSCWSVWLMWKCFHDFSRTWSDILRKTDNKSCYYWKVILVIFYGTEYRRMWREFFMVSAMSRHPSIRVLKNNSWSEESP